MSKYYLWTSSSVLLLCCCFCISSFFFTSRIVFFLCSNFASSDPFLPPVRRLHLLLPLLQYRFFHPLAPPPLSPFPLSCVFLRLLLVPTHLQSIALCYSQAPALPTESFELLGGFCSDPDSEDVSCSETSDNLSNRLSVRVKQKNRN